jgi:hypothetical protein
MRPINRWINPDDDCEELFAIADEITRQTYRWQRRLPNQANGAEILLQPIDRLMPLSASCGGRVTYNATQWCVDASNAITTQIKEAVTPPTPQEVDGFDSDATCISDDECESISDASCTGESETTVEFAKDGSCDARFEGFLYTQDNSTYKFATGTMQID